MVDNKEKSSEAEVLSEEWENSRRYANLFGTVPSSFGSLIRGLIADQQKNGQLSFAAKWQMNRLLRSGSMKAAYYFALRTFRKDLFVPGGARLSLDDMITAFKPIDLASLLAILYLYRRARHLADPEEWKFIAPPIHTRCDLGGQIGMVIENVGLAIGLLAGAARNLAMVAFHLHDKAGYTEYRRQLKISKRSFNLEMERKRWKCTHVQIASNLLLALGLGGNLAELVCNGMEMDSLEVELARTRPYAFRVCEAWIDSLLATGAPPDIVHSGLYYPLKEDLARLVEEARSSVASGSQYFWLDKGKESINPKDTPELMALLPDATGHVALQEDETEFAPEIAGEE